MNKHHIISILALVILMPAVAAASPVIRSGDNVSVAVDQIIEGDFYAAGGTVTISGEARGDVYIAGGSVTVNAPVANDLVIAGGTVQVHAPIADDLRVAGGDVTLAGSVTGDVLVLGGSVKLLSTASINGDLIFAAGEIDVGGSVNGSIIGAADVVRIDAPVGGNIDVSAAHTLSLGDRAEMGGDVAYRSAQEMVRAQGSVVGGSIMRGRAETGSRGDSFTLLPVATVLFAALAALFLFKPKLQVIVDSTKASYGQHGLIGLGVFVLTPIAAALLMVSVLGIVPGVMLIFGYVLVLMAVFVVTGIVFGTLVLEQFMHTREVGFVSTVTGVLSLSLIALIPFAGPLFAAALFLIVLGGAAKRMYAALR